MKYIITIILLVAFTVNQTAVGEVLKLPVFVMHFYKHKKLEKVSMTVFLKDHYASQHDDEDQPEDNRLPFKSGIVQDIGNSFFILIKKFDFTINYNFSDKLITRVCGIPQKLIYSIFHPPQQG